MFSSKKQGFTLIELLVVISILAVLAMIGFFAYSQIFKGARDTKRQSDFKTIQSALEQYRADQFNYPASLPWSNPLCSDGSSCANGSKKYLNLVPTDPITNNPPYVYKGLQTDGTQCTSANETKCKNYCLYARLENSLTATPISGTSCSPYPADVNQQSYNLFVTKP